VCLRLAGDGILLDFCRFRCYEQEAERWPYRRAAKPCLQGEPRSEAHMEQAVVDFAIEQPALWATTGLSNELKKRGLFVSPGGVRSI